MMRKLIPLMLACGLLAACGGSGGDASPGATDNPPANTNTSPTISGAPATSVAVGSAYDFVPQVVDPDGPRLSFTVASKPAWVAFDAVTGRLSGTPSAADVGTYNGIVISVSDSIASVSLQAFSIQVTGGAPGNPPNQPPVISGTPATSVTSGQNYSFTPTASDPDGQTLSFSIANTPSWASFNAATGALSGTPAAADAGTYSNIVISVSDGAATVSLPSFTITATAAISTAELYWSKPTNNEDGTPLTDLAGYKIRYGTLPGALNRVVDVVGAAVTSASIEGLSAGTWFFSIASYTSGGVESAPTGTVSVTF
jgi:Putative Ig domain